MAFEASNGGAAVDDGSAGADADLRVYSENLGIGLEDDAELQWLAQEAFDAPLPASWTEHTDDEGRIYFFNETSSESAWEHPMDAVYRELVKLVKQVQRDEASADEAARGRFVHEHLRQVHQRALDAIENWGGPYCSEAGEYYYNAELKASVWENPLARWEHELVLRHSVLCRCLLPERCLVSADGLVERIAPAARVMSGPELLQALQLPLNLLRQASDSDAIPETPSTCRSYHTARSLCSSRSQLSSNRSGERRRSKDRHKSHKGGKDGKDRSPSRSSKEKDKARSVCFEGQAPAETQEDRTTIFSRPGEAAAPAAMVPAV